MSTQKKTLAQRLRRLVAEPAIGLRKLWLIHVAKDPRILAYRAWKQANRTRDLRLDYALDAHSIVFDLGGYVGDFAEDIHRRTGAQVYLFEPSLAFHAICEKRFAETPAVHCFAYGLGARERDMLLTDDADASSVVEEKAGHMAGETVHLRDAAEVIEELGIARIDLLKINIEGGEYEVLPHLIEMGFADRIIDFQIQFHDFVEGAEAQRDAIRAALAKTHDCTWSYDFVWENWHRRGA